MARAYVLRLVITLAVPPESAPGIANAPLSRVPSWKALTTSSTDRLFPEALPVDHVIRYGHADLLVAAFDFSVVEHDVRMSERPGVIPDNLALAKRDLFDIPNIGLVA